MNFFLDTVATVERPGVTKSDAGEVTQTWTTIATDAPFSIQPQSGEIRAAQAGLEHRSDYKGFCHAGIDVRQGDRLTSGGVSYRVLFVARYRTHRESDLETIAG